MSNCKSISILRSRKGEKTNYSYSFYETSEIKKRHRFGFYVVYILELFLCKKAILGEYKNCDQADRKSNFQGPFSPNYPYICNFKLSGSNSIFHYSNWFAEVAIVNQFHVYVSYLLSNEIFISKIMACKSDASVKYGQQALLSL